MANVYGEIQAGVILKMSSRVTGVSGTKRYFDIPMPTRPFVNVSFVLNAAISFYGVGLQFGSNIITNNTPEQLNIVTILA